MAYKLVGYFENWAQYRGTGGKFVPEQIDPTLFTHINFAFGLFNFVTWSVDPTETRTGDQRYTGDYSVQPVEWNDQTVLYPALQKLKAANSNLKTLLSIGGWSINSGDDVPSGGNPHPYGPFTYRMFSEMAADQNKRAQFIASAIPYAQKYGFDGVDIDWEYPGYLSRGGTPQDLPNFLSLVQEFRSKAPSGFLLTMAAPAIVPTGMPDQYHQNPDSYFSWLAQCAQSFDWLNVMCYDYHGAFDDPAKGTGVNAPLLQDSTLNGPYSAKNTVDAYLKAGIVKDKIVLGMPTYGRSFSLAAPPIAPTNGYRQPFTAAGPAGAATGVPGVLAYYEILAQLASGELTAAWDDATLTPYAYSRSGNTWASYDDPKSLGYKVSYVIERGLGGAMIWSIDDDAFSAATAFPLVRAVKVILDNPATRPALPTAAVDANAQALANAIKNNQSLGNARTSALFVLFFVCGTANVDPGTFVKNNKVTDGADANATKTFHLAAQTFALLNAVTTSNASDEALLNRFRNALNADLGIFDLVRGWAEQRADVARRWAEAEKSTLHGGWAPIDQSSPPKPADTRVSVYGAGDAVRRLCEGYGDVLRRRGEAWKRAIPASSRSLEDVQSSLSMVIGFWQADVSFTQQTVDLSFEVQGNPQDVLVRLKEALSDAQARLTEGGVSVDFSNLLGQYRNQNGLRLAEAYGDGFRRISEGWKDALLRLKEVGIYAPNINQLASNSVTWLFGKFMAIVSAPK